MYRHAYLYFIVALVLTLVAFTPSYLSQLAKSDRVQHFHGIVATAWMLLLITQSWLYSRRKLALHRAIGKFSIILAILFVISGAMIVHHMVTGTGGFARKYGVRLSFLDVTTTLYFIVAYCLALRYRHTLALHSRFMTSTLIMALPPGLVRLIGNFMPGISSFSQALHLSFFITELMVIGLLFHDRRVGAPRTPYLMLLAVLIIGQVGFVVIPYGSWWPAVAGWIASF